MSFSQSELDALRSAYATGTLRVTYDGRTVEYGNAEDLERRIRFIEGEMNRPRGRRRASYGVVGYGRGDR